MKQLINNPLPRLMTVIAATLVLVASLGSCSKYDDTDLKDSIAALDERLAALEAIKDGIQSDINDLQALVEKLEGGVTVDEVVTDADGYTIRFSDGTSVTITDGKDGEKGEEGPQGPDGIDGEDGEDAPVVIVMFNDEDGIYYWGYRNADGSENYILVDGEPVPASGITPQVDINEEGEWIISVDNGATWQETGVSAGAKSVFKNVEETETTVVITLNDGNDTQLVFAKSSGLSFKFLGADGEPVEEAYFDYAEAKVFDYTMTKPEDARLTITKPEGWDIELAESTVTVTAPSEDVMAYAESAGLVSMLLTTSEGTNAITTLRVVIGEEPVAEPTVATIAEFLSATVGDGVYYQLTGVITDIANTTYGNLTIKDETGEVYVFGLTAEGPLESNDKSFSDLGLVVYDTLTLVTVRGEYNGEAQGGGTSTPAYYVSHKDYEAPVGNPAALIISEYVEGSSNNKYLEITNISDVAVNLSAYGIDVYSNGATSPTGSASVILSGTLEPGAVKVYEHSQAALTLPEGVEAEESNATNFNGDDAIALTCNGVIVDLMGTIGSDEPWGENVTLSRKASVTAPSATYNPDEWEEAESDDVSGLGVFPNPGGSVPPVTGDAPKVGDYYYADGTWGADAANAIGVVFWVGDLTQYDSQLAADHADCTNGLVVALNNITDATVTYGSSENFTSSDFPDVSNTTVNCSSGMGEYGQDISPNFEKASGYTNTSFMSDHSDILSIISVLQGYEVAAPAKSSGWFIPSAGEFFLLAKGGNIDDCDYVSEDGGYVFTLTGTSSNAAVVNSKITAAGGTDLDVNGLNGITYWLSHTDSKFNAWVASLSGYTSMDGAAEIQYAKRSSGNYLRPVLAF